MITKLNRRVVRRQIFASVCGQSVFLIELFRHEINVIVTLGRHFTVLVEKSSEHSFFNNSQHNLINVLFLLDIFGLFCFDRTDLLMLIILIQRNVMDVQHVHLAPPLPLLHIIHQYNY